MRQILDSLIRRLWEWPIQPPEVNEMVVIHRIREWLIISNSHTELGVSIMASLPSRRRVDKNSCPVYSSGNTYR